jgi:uncharacterized LabA/DUF88 family protein
MLPNYFFIDGSSLTAQIRVLRRKDRSFENRKLDVAKFIQHFSSKLVELGSHEFKRAVFYFPKGDEVAIEQYLLVPDFNKPGTVRDLSLKFCGYKLKGSAEFTTWVETNVPSKWQDRFSKSEKGVDIEICCDALKLASASRLERLFLFANDDDFLPLCKTLKEFGANVSLIHLTDYISPNTSLVSEADSYDVVEAAALQTVFVPPFAAPESGPPPEEEPLDTSAEKASAPPSDLGDQTGPDNNSLSS